MYEHFPFLNVKRKNELFHNIDFVLDVPVCMASLVGRTMSCVPVVALFVI